MKKQKLDTWGGVASILTGIVCVYFAQQHDEHEAIWKFFMVTCVLLVLNGIAMILWARRAKAH